MTVTSLNLSGFPLKFLGAYVKNISASLGMSTNPSSCSITLVEDGDFGVLFSPPEIGKFYTINIGSSWSFSGIITKYDTDLRNIGGRTITVSMSDPREVMKLIPVIIAPGYQQVVFGISNTGCSVLDVYGAFQQGLINLSSWNQSGMGFSNFVGALHGVNILYGATVIGIQRQTVKGFGELYRFNIDEISDIVSPNYRINTNLSALTNVIEDLSSKHSFDWFVDSERDSNNIVNVTVRVIDRSVDNINLSLQEMLNDHEGKVISATSGTELRSELSCLALQGAPVEQMTKVSIKGLANEPIDFTPEGGTNKYFMTEDEMRAVIAGRQTWEVWLGAHIIVVGNEDGGVTSLGGFSRYGGKLRDNYVNPLLTLYDMQEKCQQLNGAISKDRADSILDSANQSASNLEIVGKVFDKLSSHAKKIYGKRWAHDDIFDEIIESAWTRDTVTGGTRYPNTEEPNSYFRQEDGRTRAYVEFSSEDSGGAWSLGLNNLTNLFGNLDIFRNVTRFGANFSNIATADEALIQCELRNRFNPADGMIDTDKSNYIYDQSTGDIHWSVVRKSLFVSATIDKDGVVTIDAPVMESLPDENAIISIAIEQTQLSREEISSSLNKLQLFYGTYLTKTNGRCFQPKYVYIPTRSRYNRYGPVFPSNKSENTWGKLEVIQDDGFAPWEFGGAFLMLQAMQLKVDNASSMQRESFTANIVVEGYPQYNIGDSLEKNSNINSISASFGDSVKTTYNLQTFTRKFGEFSKEDWARMALLINSGGPRILPQQQISFIEQHRVSVSKNYSGGWKSSSSVDGGAMNFG